VEAYASLQIIVLAAILASAGVFKMSIRDPRGLASDIFLLRELPESVGVLIWRCLGAIEASLAIVLIIVPGSLPRAVAAAFFVAAALYGFAARRFAPGSACGCLGSHERVSWRTPLRAGLLAGASALALKYPTSLASVRSLTAVGVEAAAVEVCLLLLLFSEIQVIPRVRREAHRQRRSSCLTSRYSVNWVIRRLTKTQPWREFEPALMSKAPTDHWRDGCWRFVTYGAMERGLPATAVFAIRLPPGKRQFRGALVIDGEMEPARVAEQKDDRRYVRRALQKIRPMLASNSGA
jgi:hypothetical protein